MIVTLKTTASEREIIEFRLDEIEDRRYDLSEEEGYENLQEYEDLMLERRELKSRLRGL
jgi:hypothetical protein